MTTRFFEHQEEARRNTTWLVVLFACAVVGILALLYALAVALTGMPETDAAGRVVAARLDWWQPDLLVQVGLATLAVVAGGSLYKIAQLRGGGAVVAESLGGRLVPSDTRDPDARRLLNVVEEMAIASGTPTPPVYLLAEEDGINAFAAGFTPSDAVIGVTRGCMRRLSRDELQGVVAHEFSHILSGDMRLNIRLMGVVHGILLIGIIGYFLLRSSMFAGGRRSSRDNSGAVMVVAGLGLMIVGFVGTFFGNLIKASVSRQREFLADASAVQFTRNPAGIAGALKKIAGLEEGSVLVSPAAPEASHLFFGQGLRGGMQMIFATHPPIEERIRRLDPAFVSPVATHGADAAPSPGGATAGLVGAATAAPGSRGARSVPASPLGAAIDQIGEPTAAHIEYAAALIAGLPPAVVEASHEPHGARAVVQALLLDPDDAVRRRQIEGLERADDPGLAAETRRLFADVAGLDPRARLPLVDLALPALRRLSPDQYARFRDDVRALAEADRRIDLFEWTLHRILLAHLRPQFERVRPPRRSLPLARVIDACSVVLSALARLGTSGEPAVRDAFDRGAAALGAAGARLLAPEDCDLAAVDRALDRLEGARASATERLIHACAACVAADGVVSQAQGELVRAIADSLGCPMPPLLPGQRLA